MKKEAAVCRREAIRDAVLRSRERPPAPAPVPVPLPGPFTVGSPVVFRDAKGKYVSGKILDDDTLRVLESNLVSAWTVLYKHPYMTWEQCLEVEGGVTRIKPRDLIGFTRLYMEDVEAENREEIEDSGRGSDDDGNPRRRTA